MRQVYCGFVVFLLILILFLHPSEEGPDAFHYLAWGHSIFYDHDLSLLDQFKALQLPDYHFTVTGMVEELRNFGLALFWLPFYALAAPHTNGGISDSIQILFLTWSTLLYSTLACGLMLVALQRFYSPKAAWVTVILLGLGTPLAFYAVQQPISAHPASVCLAALFLLFCLKKAKTRWHYVSVGVLAGWLMLLATYNVVVLLIPLTEILGALLSTVNFTSPKFTAAKWRCFFLDNSALALGAFLGFLPQLLVWHLLYGGLLVSPYARQMQWSEPALIEVLLSPFHGLLIYAPILLFVPLGLSVLARQKQALAIGIGLSWLGLIYLTGANLAWWAGMSFGNRYFLVLSPFFALAIGALLQQSYHWLWLMVPCWLWTIGLWLESLVNIPMLVSANRYYSLPTLWAKQLFAWQSMAQLLFSTPPRWLTSTSPLIIAEILLLSGVGYFLGYYALRLLGKLGTSQQAYLLGTLSLVTIGYVALLGYRSQSQRLPLATVASVSHSGLNYDPFDLSESYMERAKYHIAIKRPDLALADAQKAAQVWPSTERQVVAYGKRVALPLSRKLDAQYGPIRLLGYQWQAPNKLVLCWQKTKHDDDNIYNPLIQMKGAKDKLIGQRQLNDPFPAKLISIGYSFCDNFVLKLKLPTDKFWFAVSFPGEQLQQQEFYVVR